MTRCQTGRTGHAWAPTNRRVADFVVRLRRCRHCGAVEALADGPRGDHLWHRLPLTARELDAAPPS